MDAEDRQVIVQAGLALFAVLSALVILALGLGTAWRVFEYAGGF